MQKSLLFPHRRFRRGKIFVSKQTVDSFPNGVYGEANEDPNYCHRVDVDELRKSIPCVLHASRCDSNVTVEPAHLAAARIAAFSDLNIDAGLRKALCAMYSNKS